MIYAKLKILSLSGFAGSNPAPRIFIFLMNKMKRISTFLKKNKKIVSLVSLIITLIIIPSLVTPSLQTFWVNIVKTLSGDYATEKVTIVQWQFANSIDEVTPFVHSLREGDEWCTSYSENSDKGCSLIEHPCDYEPFVAASPPNFSQIYCNDCSVYTINVGNEGKTIATEFKINLCFDKQIIKILNNIYEGEGSNCLKNNQFDKLFVGQANYQNDVIFLETNSTIRFIDVWDSENKNISNRALITDGLRIDNNTCFELKEFFSKMSKNEIVEKKWVWMPLDQ
jgi:hypothetical protein